MDIRPDVFAYIRQNAQFNFVWSPTVQHLCVSVRENPLAKYAVMFQITCAAPFHTVCLAYALLRFKMENTSLPDYHHFRLVDLSYKYLPGRIYGVMIFDGGFSWAWQRATNLALLECNGFYKSHDVPCSRWISEDADWVDGGVFTDRGLMTAVNKAMSVFSLFLHPRY